MSEWYYNVLSMAVNKYGRCMLVRTQMRKSISVLAIAIAVCVLARGQQNNQHADVKMYGATGDGKTDDAPAVRKAVAAVEAAGGGICLFSGGELLLQLHEYYAVHPSAGNKAYVNLNGNGIHVQCAPGAVLNTSPAIGPTLFMFGLYGDGVRGAVGYKNGFAANPITAMGASSITLSTAADASHFKAGELIYILGGQEWNRMATAN